MIVALAGGSFRADNSAAEACGGQPTTTKPPAQPSPEFEKLLKAATDARQAERWDEAIGLYAKLVKLKPDYVEGYWYQGAAYYAQDDFPHCKEAFRKVTSLAPKNGAAYAFFGLCEFGLKEYDRSLQHLLQSRIHGIGDVPDLGGVARYHAAILMSRMEQYEQALETLGEFAGEGNDNPRVIEAMGIATLRLPMLPDRNATRSPRDDPDGRPRQLHDGDPQHRGCGTRLRSARLPATRRRRTCTTPTGSSCCRKKVRRRSRSSSASSRSSRIIPGR